MKKKINFAENFFSIIILSISTILIIYVFYRSEFYYSGRLRGYYLNHYIVLVTLIFLSIISFFFSKKIKTYFKIVLISFFASLYLAELYLILNIKNHFTLKKHIKIYKKNTGKNYDTRTGAEIFEELKIKNKDVVFSINPQYIENNKNSIYTLGGLSNVETLFCNENGYYSIYQSDRYGFNNPDYEWDKSLINYLIVGDSFAHGTCVNRPDDIASNLRNLTNSSSLSLGYKGTGPLIQYATLREYLPQGVQNVIWFFTPGNDTFDLENELKSEILIKYLNDKNFTQNFKIRQKEIDILIKKKLTKQIKKNTNHNKIIFRTLNLLKLGELRAQVGLYKYKKREINPQFINIIKQAKELSNKNGSNFYFVYLPDIYKLDYNLYENIINITEELNINFIDLQKEFNLKEINLEDFLPFGSFGHFNEKGYKKVAEFVNNFVSNDIK